MGGNTQGLLSGTFVLSVLHLYLKKITNCSLIYTQFKNVSISQSGIMLPSSYHTYSDNSGFTGLYVLILQQKSQVHSGYVFFLCWC
jgi:hypothetical protein